MKGKHSVTISFLFFWSCFISLYIGLIPLFFFRPFYSRCLDSQNGFSIKSVNIAGARDLLVTGEDSKTVNLWRCPANAEGNAFASYAGHASFVTAVRFTADDARVLSCGGNDKCIFQWAVRR